MGKKKGERGRIRRREIEFPCLARFLRWNGGKERLFRTFQNGFLGQGGRGRRGKKMGIYPPFSSSLLTPQRYAVRAGGEGREYLRWLQDSKKVNGSFCSRKPHKVNTRDFKLPRTRCTYNRRVRKYVSFPPKTTFKPLNDNFNAVFWAKSRFFQQSSGNRTFWSSMFTVH